MMRLLNPATECMADYAPDGKRLTTMTGTSILWGQFGTIHNMESLLGAWMVHLENLFGGLSIRNGKTTLALLSMPNPIMIGE